jgi:hypothetical protein
VEFLRLNDRAEAAAIFALGWMHEQRVVGTAHSIDLILEPTIRCELMLLEERLLHPERTRNTLCAHTGSCRPAAFASAM